jgi:hypothetical protein
MRALLVYPTHSNCHEVAADLRDEEGWDAVCYPARLTSASKDQPENCWNKEADAAEQYGLPVLKSVCVVCPHQSRCKSSGYLAQLHLAASADVALATHKRAASSGLTELARDSTVISVHESAVELLRPSCRIQKTDLVVLRQIIGDLLNDPYWLNWFGNDLATDDDGNQVHDAEQKVQRDRLYQASIALADLVDHLMAALESANETVAWTPPDPIPIPERFERLLFRVLKQARAKLGSEVCQFILAALAGSLASAAIMVHDLFADSKQGPTRRRSKTVMGVRQTPLPNGRTIWFSDSTANAERMARIVGAPVIDSTPDGTVPLQKKAVQFVTDITVKTSPEVVCSILRGILARYSDRHRIGVITHRAQLKAIEKLDSALRSRIAESTYFHSGQDRSSNSWHVQCDLLLILGTPRVPPSAVAEYLVQVGELKAACTEPPWDTLYWLGETEQDQPLRVEGRGYQNEAWRSAHRDLVRATLVQAIGRGRGILESGCDVLVFSTEECGLRISADLCPWMNEPMAEVYGAVRDLTATKSKKYYLEKVAVSSAEVADHLSKPERTIRRCLSELEPLGLLERLGPRSGWRLKPRDDVSCFSPALSSAAQPVSQVSLKDFSL